jgi:hypothetical protein
VTGESGSLRVALVHHPPVGAEVYELAASLRELGHAVTVLSPDGGRVAVVEAVLDRRGFATPLTHIPWTVQALMRGDYDVAHAFTPQDTYAALIWRRRRGRPVLFSLTEPVERERLADRRLRLRLLGAALDQSDAVIVHGEQARAAAWLWLAVELPVIDPHDGAAHERLYRRLLAQT